MDGVFSQILLGIIFPAGIYVLINYILKILIDSSSTKGGVEIHSTAVCQIVDQDNKLPGGVEKHSIAVCQIVDQVNKLPDSPSITDKYNIVIFGKTGKGKSCLGNLLLNRKVFVHSSSGSSCTKLSTLQANIINGIHLNVIDTPGLMDTDDSQELILSRVYDAMGLCSEGFHAFLICLRFGDRYTEEESNVINILERAFGPEFFKVCILAITHGDLFDTEDLNITFAEWVQQNTSSFKGLFEKCGNRVYLFHNKGGVEKHFLAVRQIVDQVKKLPDKYLTETFAKYVNERIKISVELKQPQLIASIQEKTSIFTAFIEKAVEKIDEISEADIENIKIKGEDLLKWIEEEDKKTGIMAEYKVEVQGYIDNINFIASSKNKREKLKKILHKLKVYQTSFINTLVGTGKLLILSLMYVATSNIPEIANKLRNAAYKTATKLHVDVFRGKHINSIEQKLNEKFVIHKKNGDGI